MSKIESIVLPWGDNEHMKELLFKGIFGLEKEHVRVTPDGKVALTPHPEALGDKLNHPYITTDFSESQVEIITPPLQGVENAYNMLSTLHTIVDLHIGDEYLWPQSTPPILPQEGDIPLAQFGSGQDSQEREQYRKHLSKRYGRKKQMISGIHVNFSFDSDFLRQLYKYFGNHRSTYQEFQNNRYLKVMRNTMTHSWLLIKLLGCSPMYHESYAEQCKGCRQGLSVRNGSCGYGNQKDLYAPMDSLESYVSTILGYVESGVLHSAKEHYSLIRAKNKQGSTARLIETGIDYLELRLVDLNPLFPLGISKADLYLIHTFFIAMLLLEDTTLSKDQFAKIMKKNRQVADSWRIDAPEITQREEALAIMGILLDIAKLSPDTHYRCAIEEAIQRINNPKELYAHRIYQELQDTDFVRYHMQKAHQYRGLSEANRFYVKGYQDMELSTQILILDALRRGIQVEILDRSENFIRLSQGSKVEYVKEATKTSKDTYSTVLLMEHKGITKKLLREVGIKTPIGNSYTCLESALADYYYYADTPIVVKPNSTNFGVGITTFTKPCTKEAYKTALEVAFSHDTTVLVEHFIQGNEYRVFVIENRVAAALNRVPANVRGDGIRTIRELVEDKNQDPLRGEKYQKPLQKIVLGVEQELFLQQHGMNFNTVPSEGEQVFLSKKSNISTGGDSIDCTDEISESFKKVAVSAAQAMGAAITGVDIITKDISVEFDIKDVPSGGECPEHATPSTGEYAIIELNFNPAMHIHCFPYKGKNRHLGDKVLDLLGFER